MFLAGDGVAQGPWGLALGEEAQGPWGLALGEGAKGPWGLALGEGAKGPWGLALGEGAQGPLDLALGEGATGTEEQPQASQSRIFATNMALCMTLETVVAPSAQFQC